jgi:hypothetical protein
VKQSLLHRLLSKAQQQESCWFWTGAKNELGYGYIDVQGRQSLAHRVSYELQIGPIPAGLLVLHECDNPSCINPTHLTVGTQSKNMRDKLKRGRANNPRGEAHWMYGKSEGLPSAKLNWKSVREIRERYASGEVQTALAAKYGVGQGTISSIVRNETWAQ